MESSFVTGSLAQLFPTPVWSFQPVQAAALCARLVPFLQSLRAADTNAAPASPIWQSRDDLHERSELTQLVAFVHEAAEAARSMLQVSAQLKLTGMWGNISRGSAALHDHTHPNNYLSGVFYVRMPPGAGAITFKDPRTQTRVLRPQALADTPLNSLELEYAASEGTLLLFPAWLEHGVRPSRTDEERITIAWNLMLSGTIGSHSQLAYSEL
jgi:uncharacterized protein (TIGR02466 family)